MSHVHQHFRDALETQKVCEAVLEFPQLQKGGRKQVLKALLQQPSNYPYFLRSILSSKNKKMLKRSGFKLIQMATVLSVMLITSCKTSGQNNADKDGFVQIFDGKTLTGWEGDQTYWRVENGNLVGEITPATLLKTNSFIIWQGGRPANFELTLEFKITKAGNSGINYRSIQLKDIPHALKGYQADIDGADNIQAKIMKNGQEQHWRTAVKKSLLMHFQVLQIFIQLLCKK